jgi:lysophospholipase L1-like esterase
MVSRFAADVTAANPKIVIIEGGVNDIFGAFSAATTIANMQTMVSAAQAANILPIILTVNPWTGMNTTQSTTRDTINAALLAMASASCVVINQDPILGVFRTGGPAGNLWNVNPLYDSGDGGHLNAAGYARVAGAIASTIQGRQGPRG